MWETALGRKHLKVATVLNNLALVYKEQGRYSEAEPLYERASAIEEAVRGWHFRSTIRQSFTGTKVDTLKPSPVQAVVEDKGKGILHGSPSLMLGAASPTPFN
jgi:hypothetical protein